MTQAQISAFDAVARGLLDRHQNDPLRVLPSLRKILMKRSDLLDALALARLVFLVSASSGLAMGDAPREAAEEEAAAGHRVVDAHRRDAGGGSPSSSASARKPIKVREHRRAKQRTDRDRNIERAAMTPALAGVFARPVLGRAIGKWPWHEVAEGRRASTYKAVDHVMLGRDAAEDAILMDLLLCHATPSDPNALVEDVISAEDMAKLQIEAKRLALPRLDVSKGAAHAEFVRQLGYQNAAP